MPTETSTPQSHDTESQQEQSFISLLNSMKAEEESPCGGTGDCAEKTDCTGKGDCEGKGDCHDKGDCGDKGDCADHVPSRTGFWHGLFMKGLKNTLNLSFDEVYKEPKKILMIGGCRQRDFAQHVALLLPAADITLIDPDEKQVQAAKEEICCRFKFVTSSLEALPFEDGQFDLVIAHHLSDYVDALPRALAEIQRVVSREQGNIMLSLLNPAAMTLFSWLPGFKTGLASTGVSLGGAEISEAQLKKSVMANNSKLALTLTPMPWQWFIYRFQS